MKSHKATGLRRILLAVQWSRQGLTHALRNEAAFRQEALLFCVLAPLGIWLGISPLEKVALVSSLLLVLIVELLNSAVEAAVDRVGAESHPLAGQAKDMGSAAVFLSLLNAALVWAGILFWN